MADLAAWLAQFLLVGLHMNSKPTDLRLLARDRRSLKWLQGTGLAQAASNLGASALATSILVACLLFSVSLRAQPENSGSPHTTVRAVDSDAKAEARWRFDRGVRLYEQGDFRGALVEFQRAYDLTGHHLVRYNIGLVHAKLGDSLESVEALGPLVTEAPEVLGEERYEKAKQTYDEHTKRVGTLEVATNVPNAVIRVDMVDVARAPAPPLPVTAGSHVVSVFAPGYEPRRVPVMVAGQAHQQIAINLIPLEQEYAQLQVSTSVPDVDVWAGEELIGRTPFASSVAFKPGVHELTLRRAGYEEEKRTLALQPGSVGQLHVDMKLDETQSAASGTLMLSVDQPHAVVWVNGQPRLDFSNGMRLPLGRHRIKVQRDGFYDAEREVNVAKTPTRVEVALFPTSGYMADYVQNAQSQRVLSWVTIGAGAALTAGGGAFLIWNAGEKERAEERFDRFADQIEREEASGMCSGDDCDELDRRLSAVEDARGRDLYGWLGVAAGAAAITTGIVLYATSDDPHRYDPELEEDVVSSWRVDVGLGGATLRGEF